MDFSNSDRPFAQSSVIDSINNPNPNSGSYNAYALPTAPTNLMGLVQGSNATLSWDPPLVAGSSNISMYYIYLITGSSSVLIGSTSNTTFIVPNLIPMRTYVFGIQALNSQSLLGAFAYVTLNTACFLKGTKILCWNAETEQEEYRLIESLRKGMKVKTIYHGYIAIEKIGKSTLYNAKKEKKNKDGLYKLEKEAYPELFEDLYMTGAHSRLVKELTSEQEKDVMDMLGDIYITDDFYRLPVAIDESAIPYNEQAGFEIWHFALENEHYYYNYGVYANGLLVETCSLRYMNEDFPCEIVE